MMNLPLNGEKSRWKSSIVMPYCFDYCYWLLPLIYMYFLFSFLTFFAPSKLSLSIRLFQFVRFICGVIYVCKRKRIAPWGDKFFCVRYNVSFGLESFFLKSQRNTFVLIFTQDSRCLRDCVYEQRALERNYFYRIAKMELFPSAFNLIWCANWFYSQW